MDVSEDAVEYVSKMLPDEELLLLSKRLASALLVLPVALPVVLEPVEVRSLEVARLSHLSAS